MITHRPSRKVDHPYTGFFAASLPCIALPCQYAACFAATSLARRASGDLCVLATTWHTRVCLRVAVLHKSPRCAAAVRLTAAKQAAFGIIDCVRRYGAAFFTRARSDGVFSRAIRGEEASPGVVACFFAALQSVASSHARLSLAPRANRSRRASLRSFIKPCHIASLDKP